MDGATRPLVLRPAAPDDAALIHALVAELAEYEQLGHEVEAGAADLAAALAGAPPRVFAEIAEWRGEPAGFSLWFYNYSTFRGRHGIYLEDLFVRPAFRGRGIGKALIANLARRCVDEDLPRLQWQVLDWNEPSIAFYRSLGARLTPEWVGCRLEGAAIEALAAGGGR